MSDRKLSVWRITLSEFPKSLPIWTEDAEVADSFRGYTTPYDVVEYVLAEEVEVIPVEQAERDDRKLELLLMEQDRDAVVAEHERFKERLTSDKTLETVIDFLGSWRFCPVSSASNPSRPCLEDAGRQLLDAIKAAAEERG